jgi:hypothetical protein
MNSNLGDIGLGALGLLMLLIASLSVVDGQLATAGIAYLSCAASAYVLVVRRSWFT